MTLFNFFGLYGGWDRCGHPHIALRIYSKSTQLQLGLLLLGCDWFFSPPNAGINKSTTQR